MQQKERLDVLLVERGLSESREKAKATIMAGLVFVKGNVVIKREQSSLAMWISL